MEDAEAPETAETGDAAFLGSVFWRVNRWKTYIHFQTPTTNKT
jgi:hypothetical protein